MKIILASSSKRRSSILSSCGIKHKVIGSGVKEDLKGRDPKVVTIKNARLKAEKVLERVKSGYIIGADTIVLLGQKIIGKPRNLLHAKDMLKAMSGKTVSVYTGLSVIDAESKNLALDYERSEVNVVKIRPKELSKYFNLLGPYDKAGGFSIEGVGSFIFDNIKGSYFNVLGLPVMKLKKCFEKLGVDILKIIN